MFGLRSLVETEDGWNINTDLSNKILDINQKPQSIIKEEKKTKGYRIILSNGQKIEVSEGHLFRIYDKLEPYDVPVEKLKIGTQLGIKRNNYFKIMSNQIPKNIHDIDKDFVYVFGYRYGYNK